MTLAEFKKYGIEKLKKKSPSPQLDLEVLLQYSLNCDRTYLLLHAKDPLPQDKENWLQEALQKRITGLPIAYITGHKEFYGFDFLVSPAVLIPKPDTEILVERALDLIIEKMEARPNQLLTICDMCTGSGCIGLSVMKSLIDLYKLPLGQLPKITLIDISPEALEIAEKNIKHLGLPRELFRIVRSNLFEQFSQEGGWTFDLILTNPPYIPHTMVDQLLQDGRSEPRLALDGDVSLTGDPAYTIDGDKADDGLEIIRNLIPQAKTHLSPKGIILMETGEYNAKAAACLAQNHDFKTQIHKDLEGQLRLVEMY
ncbi:MAG: peptide chain release factor N(5)-glutamine methyltransferase [Treponema sp.]|nr:peptide chain release factor N(5)-glutamine methyltransferase [Treponema sp.]